MLTCWGRRSEWAGGLAGWLAGLEVVGLVLRALGWVWVRWAWASLGLLKLTCVDWMDGWMGIGPVE